MLARTLTTLLLVGSAHADYLYEEVFAAADCTGKALFHVANYPQPCQPNGGESLALQCSNGDANATLLRFPTFGCTGTATATLPLPFSSDCTTTDGPPRRQYCKKGAYAEPLALVNLGLYLTPGNDQCLGEPSLVQSVPAGTCLKDLAEGSVLLTCSEPGHVGEVVEKLYSDAACAGAANVTVHPSGCRLDQARGGLAAAVRRAAAGQAGALSALQAASGATPSRSPSASQTPPAPPAPAPGRDTHVVWKCPTA